MALVEKNPLIAKIGEKYEAVQSSLSDRVHKLFGNKDEKGMSERIVQGGLEMAGDMANPTTQFGVVGGAIGKGAGSAIAGFGRREVKKFVQDVKKGVGVDKDSFDHAMHTASQKLRNEFGDNSDQVRAFTKEAGAMKKLGKNDDIKSLSEASPKDQKRFNDIIEGNVDEAAMIKVSGKTVTNREIAALPVRDIMKDKHLIDGDVLYIGAGKDFPGGKLMGKDGRKVTMTDPNVPKGAPEGYLANAPEGQQFDNVVSVFTAQTLQPAIRKGFFEEIGKRMKPGGQAIVAVRGTGGGIKGIMHQDGVVNLTRGTFQKPYTGKILKDELEGFGFKVEVIQGGKSVSPSTVMVKLTKEGATGTPTKVTKTIDSMSFDEIGEQIKLGTGSDAKMLEGLFGKEGAKKYNSLQKKANSHTGDEVARSRASTQLADMEDSLSQANQDKLFGIGDDFIDVDLLKDVKKEMSYIRSQDGSPAELGEALKYSITRLGDDIHPSQMSPEQLTAFMGMREALSIAKAKGYSTLEVSKAAIKGSAERFSDPADAQFMLEKFLKKIQLSPVAKQLK